MALLFVYLCPRCQNEIALVSPVQPLTVTCGVCGSNFTVVPVDERTIQYVHTMLGEGKAAVDPCF